MTTDLDAIEVDILRRYPRAVYHLRAQLHRGKLMPVFGAGASQSIGLPDWNTLVKRIAEHPRVKAAATAAGTTSQASRVQLIFHHFRRSQLQAQAMAGTIPDENSVSISVERK